MTRFLLPIAALSLIFAACGDDATPLPASNDTGTGTGTSDIGLDIPIEEDGGECTPDCAGRECGDDGCGSSCGDCAANSDCVAGVCVDNTPSELSCEEIIDCINSSGGEQADMNNCIGQGTTEGQALINDILTCIQTNCADATTDEEFAECQQAECQVEINACFGIGEGTDSCEEVVDCLLGCTTQECGNACVSEGTSDAQAEAIAGFNCAAESCAEATSQDEFFTCFEASCPDEYNECYDIIVEPADPTCEEYCAQMGDACADTYADEDACLAYCGTAGAFPAGNFDDTSGNTIGCRMYHAGVASGLEGDDNALHCGHAGPSGADTCGTWCENYCDLALNTCSGDNKLYDDGESCLAACDGFGADGEAGDAGGDTVQCRIYHLGVAGSDGEESAAVHCPHGGEDGGGVCVAPDEPTCDDGIANGDEDGVDCGGSCPEPCET